MIFFYNAGNGEIRPWCAHYGQPDGAAQPDRVVEIGEIEGCYERMRSAVWTAARADEVCRTMLTQALDRFGLWFPYSRKTTPVQPDGHEGPRPQAGSHEDPTPPGDCLSRSEMMGLIDDIFYYWAHPSIGNAITSPQLRPPHVSKQDEPGFLRGNWNTCNKISENDKTSILNISKSKMFERFDHAARDQVRIVHDDAELARAIVGEITTLGTKRLEKILALRLCDSPSFQRCLCWMVNDFFAEGITKEVIEALKRSKAGSMCNISTTTFPTSSKLPRIVNK